MSPSKHVHKVKRCDVCYSFPRCLCSALRWERTELTLLCLVCNTTTDRKHADTFLEKCVAESVVNIVSGFFNSLFSDNSTSLQQNGKRRKRR
ncbi:inositol 1,4,5-trisphosphate-gated calcium channel ITPR1-like isoform X2 [Camelus bactrianus]|uniref:Inositol 1,4,5-trisphosphate-gated calcium channel ITPR1-like isoform X2 n=1 Tax=Camelus bactrianus TaxID=9837 RepID=A0AC58PUD2_CAMBA